MKFNVMLLLHAVGVFCFCTAEISGSEMDVEGPYQGLRKQQTQSVANLLGGHKA